MLANIEVMGKMEKSLEAPYYDAQQKKVRVVVTGLGIVSPLGSDITQFWSRLCAGESGVAPATSFDTSSFASSLVAEVCDFDQVNTLGAKLSRRTDRVTQFGLLAALRAWSDSGFDVALGTTDDIGVCAGTSIGGLGTAFRTHDLVREGNLRRISPFTMSATFANALSGEISIALGVTGPSESISNGCSSTASAMVRAAELIRNGECRAVVVVGAEAPLHPTIFAAMEAGGMLAPDDGGRIRDLPRPFDARRCGIVMGEGAGSVILEDYSYAAQRGARIYGELVGSGASCDAYSMFKPREDGMLARLAIEKAIQTAGWNAHQVDYINACGLGTTDLDRVETHAIKMALGQDAGRIPISSVKGALGHAFAASGIFQIITSLLSIRDGIIPPTLHLSESDPECDLSYVRKMHQTPHLQRILVNSFGFGGKNVVLALAQVDR
ncbi:beta-ketoacyl-[acyl-carrier-protein] synthase family protein [Sulfurirhabdus autotrophica]|nr:beta-ketoacyl-[acyl-carrier-protein] synthase family protein [Sulfurirhabdus autotrophica]